MERRAFLAASTAAAVTSADALTAAAQGPGAPSRPQVLELRRYRLRNCALASRFASYAKDALVPALGRAGLAPIGAWNVAMGPDSPTVHLLIPHPDAASVVTLDERLGADGDYRKAAASSLALPPGEPAGVQASAQYDPWVAGQGLAWARRGPSVAGQGLAWAQRGPSVAGQGLARHGPWVGGQGLAWARRGPSVGVLAHGWAREPHGPGVGVPLDDGCQEVGRGAGRTLDGRDRRASSHVDTPIGH